MAVLGSIWAACGATAPAATASSTVGVTVPSATSIDSSGCAAGVPGKTEFGTVLAGATASTTLPCVIVAGSSNDTARLWMSQSDGAGSALWRVATDHRDASFGTSGLVLFDESGAVDRFNDAVLQPDGKLVAVGCSGTDIVVARFDETGALDPTFAGDGTRAVDVGTGECASFVTLEASGTITVGASATITGQQRAVVIRIDGSGGMVNAFDTDGIWYEGAAVSPAPYVAIDAQGRILFGSHNNANMMLGRLLPTGAKDPAFHGGTSIMTVIDAGSENVFGIVEHASGDIYIAATTSVGMGQAYIARITTAGVVDGTFGGGAGFEQFSLSNPRFDVDSTGRMLLVGQRTSRARVIRFLADGTYDNSFGASGIVEFDPTANLDSITAIAELGDGRLLATGVTNGDTVFTVLLDDDGTLDAEHGSGALQYHDIASGIDLSGAIASTGDGSVLIAGSATGATEDGFLLALDGATVPDHDGAGADWNAANGAFGVCLNSATGTNLAVDVTAHAGCALTPASAWWIPVAAAPVSILHSSAATSTDLTANLYFGVRSAVSQRPGTYRAGITFDVVAPG